MASLLVPPIVDITSGVKEACSTSLILCSYDLSFSFSCLLQHVVVDRLLFEGANGLNTLTSKKDFSNIPLTHWLLAAVLARYEYHCIPPLENHLWHRIGRAQREGHQPYLSARAS